MEIELNIESNQGVNSVRYLGRCFGGDESSQGVVKKRVGEG